MLTDRDFEMGYRKLLVGQNQPMLLPDQFAAMYNGYEMSQQYFSRAVSTLDAELSKTEKGSSAWIWLKDQRDRIDMLGSVFNCQFHAVGFEWVLDRFAGKPNVDRWAQGREKKRLYDMIDQEIANCEHIIGLQKNQIKPLLGARNQNDSAFQVKLQKKIAIMKKRRGDVELIFPGVAATATQVFNYAEDGKIVNGTEAKEEMKKSKDLVEQKILKEEKK